MKVIYGKIEINFTLEYSDRKTLGIKVFPNASVKVIAPSESKDEEVFEKVKAKAKWILKQQKKYESFQPSITERIYKNGETHLYLGRQYLLQIETSKEIGVKLLHGKMIVHTPNSDSCIVKRIIKNWYREKALTLFEKMLNERLTQFDKFQITQPIIQIRWMAKRWGSCTKDGKITLNPELIRAPKPCIDYVIIHELCHIVHHNHNKSFYNLQSQIFPDWKKWKDKLESFMA